MLNIIGKETTTISLNTLKETICYFAEHFPDYKFGDILRATNDPNAKNLYMFWGKDKTGKYSVWTHWNEETQELGGEHHDICSMEEVKKILRENFEDVNNK